MNRLFILSCFLTWWAPCLVAASANKDKPQKPLSYALADLIQGSPSDFLKHFDKNGDGVLTPEELPPRFAGQFDKFDANGDGRLDQKEIQQMLQLLRWRFGLQGSSGETSPEVERLVNNILERMDADKDGKISRKEAKNRIAANFDRIDTNKDGYVDRQELRRAVTFFLANQKANPEAAPPGTVPQVPDFDSLDRNADGRLTPNELEGFPLASQFDQIDTNRDGKIDRKEFEAFFTKKITPKESRPK